MTPSVNREEKRYAYRAIIERIQAMIAQGALRPGDRLPPERKLAQNLGVSRSSLRQAFFALAERGCIESRQGDGTYLLDTGAEDLGIDALIESMSAHDGLVHDILEFRQLAEPGIAALAAQRMTDDELAQLKILVCDQQRALVAGREEDALDAEFHRLLGVSTRNAVLSQVMGALHALVDESRSRWLQTEERRRASIEGHLRIIDALEARDEKRAAAAMTNHLTEIEQHIFNDLDDADALSSHPATQSNAVNKKD